MCTSNVHYIYIIKNIYILYLFIYLFYEMNPVDWSNEICPLSWENIIKAWEINLPILNHTCFFTFKFFLTVC